MELNPNHRTTSTVHDHWHKVVAVLLHKFRDVLPNDVLITGEDLVAMESAFPEGIPSVVMDDQRDGLHVRLVDIHEARRLAKRAGGLPT